MRRSLLVAPLLLAFVLSARGAAAQSLASRSLDDSRAGEVTVVVHFFGDVQEEDAASVARELARRTGVPFGVETVRPPRQGPPPAPDTGRELRLKGQTLGELLDAFVARQPEYEWREEAGVINIRPVTAAADARDPLNRQAAPLQWADIDIHQAMEGVRRQLVAPAEMAEAPAGLPTGPMAREEWARRRFPLAFAGGTLLQLLNATVLAHGGVLWHLSLERAQGEGEWQGGQLSYGTLAGNASIGLSLPNPSLLARRPGWAATGPPRATARLGTVPPSRTSRPRSVRAFLPLDDQRFGMALQMLADATETSFGFEKKPAPQGQRFKMPGPNEPELDLTGMDARQAVARLLQELPEYEWFEAEGVINICPRGARDKPDDVLNEVVPEFEMRDVAIDQLTAAVQSIWLKRPVPPRPTRVAEDAPEPMRRRTSVSLRNATVREILNEIVRKRGRTCWEFGFELGAGDDHISVGFRADGFGGSGSFPYRKSGAGREE